MDQCVVVRELGARRDFDPFDSVHHEEPQFAVEPIPIPDDGEVGPGPQCLGAVLTERVPIGAEPVVAHRREARSHVGRVAQHASGFKEVDLLANREGGFLVLHAAAPKKENPPK